MTTGIGVWCMPSSGLASAEFTFQLSQLPASPTATLRGLFKGYSATPYHHTRIYLNNHLVDEAFSWESRAEYNFSVPIQTSDLIVGTNTIRVECPRDGEITQDIVLVNWFELDYSRAFLAENDQLDFCLGSSRNLGIPGGWFQFHEC